MAVTASQIYFRFQIRWCHSIRKVEVEVYWQTKFRRDISIIHAWDITTSALTSSSAMAERPRELGDFKKARVKGGTDNQSLKDSQFPLVSPLLLTDPHHNGNQIISSTRPSCWIQISTVMRDQHCGRPSDVYDTDRRTKLTALETVDFCSKNEKIALWATLSGLRGNVRTMAARRCLPPGAKVWVAAPANQTSFAISVFFRILGVLTNFGVSSSSLPSYSLPFSLLSPLTLPFSTLSPLPLK